MSEKIRIGGIPIEPAFIRKGQQASAYLCISPAQQDYLIEAGRLPKPIRLSERISGWRRERLDE